ncbi:MAG: iron-sulfur cluster assembly protein [Acidobacteriota bacterium]|nr:iron-sulfur cluster assembly protein [Acidobacteriota bacterium]
MGIFDPKPKKEEKADDTPKPLDQRVIDKIRLVYDPEIPVNVYEMGLIYNVEVEEAEKKANIEMTLTSPQCPAAEQIPVDIQMRVEELDEIEKSEVNIVWDPPWTPEMMSEYAKLELGWF